MKHPPGIALTLALLVTSFLSAVGLGLAVVVFMDRLASGSVRTSAGLFHAVEAGIELAAHDLARADWTEVLAGARRSTFADGDPVGVRAIPGGGAINLTAETNALNCGKATTCTAAEMDANSSERPWGANNPRWQLYAYGPLESLAALARPAPCYLAVWVADDTGERDGDPLADGDGEGRGVLRVRAVAFGPVGGRHALEAELARICATVGDEELCQPGIRVQSWLEVRQLLP